MKEKHLRMIEQMGFQVQGREYEDIIMDLIEEHIKLMWEIEVNNEEQFRREVKRLLLPTN